MRAVRNIFLILVIAIVLCPSLAQAGYFPFNTSSNLKIGIGTSNTNNAGLTVMTGNVGIGTWNPSGALDVKTGNNTLIENGNVGIGSLAPGQLLDVQGTVRDLGEIVGAGGLTLNGVTNTSWPAAGANYWNLEAGNVGINTVGYNVGIGTVTTNAQLTIGTKGQDNIDTNGNVGIGTTLTSKAALTVMNGNVGIGTWVPAAVLDVTGNTSVGYFRINSDGSINGKVNTNYSWSVDTLSNFSARNFAASYSLSAGNSIVGPGNNFGDLSTGIQLSSPSTITWALDSAYYDAKDTAISRVSAGNVGIGTSGAGTGLTNGGLMVGNIGIGTTLIATSSLSVMNGNVGVGTWVPTGLLDINRKFNVFSSGNVGIGSVSPGQLLDVQGTVRALNFVGSGAGLTGVSSQWTTTNVNDVYLPNNGNVGIGTTITSAGSALSIMNGNVGVGTWIPNSTVSFNGSHSDAYVNVTSNTTLNSSNNIVYVDSTGGAVTITLPTAVGIGGRCYKIVDAGGQAATNNITIASNGGNISGSSTQIMIDGYAADDICSNGTNWFIT